jgi:uncharacterized repeat protein (TIGR01451 family)
MKNINFTLLKGIRIRGFAAAICCVGIPYLATAQATSAGLTVKAVAEVETTTRQDGRQIVKLAPADRVGPGDQVIYTLEIRNAGEAPVRDATIVYAVPSHMRYVADSATGPGAEVRYSVDGGHTFERPENLRVQDAGGRARVARQDEYTHIRWTLRNALNANSVAFARFRAVVE